MFSRKRIFPLAITILLTVCIIPVGSQESNTAYSGDEYLDYGEAGEELVITAGRTPEKQKEVPAQVTVITAGDIAQSGAVSVVDVLETVPGIRFSGAMSGTGSEAISMRGFGENSFGRVLILIDGNKINNPDMSVANWNAISLSDIERIEVLDGSASVQYGNNASGGVINIITKKDGKRRTLIGLSGGSFFSHRESISHFQPVSWGSVSLSAEYAGTEGYRERQESRAATITAGVNIFLKDNLALLFNASFADLYFQLPGALNKTLYENNPRQANNFYDENTEHHIGASAGLQWFPTEKIELNLPFSYKGKIAGSDTASYFSYANKTLHAAEARPQSSITFDIAQMPLRLLGGVDVYFAQLDEDFFSNKDRKSANKTGFSNFSEWTIGPYLTARFSPLPNLSFTAGVRYDTAIIHADYHDIYGTDTVENTSYTAFVYEGGVVFNPGTEFKLYAKYSRIFRYPFLDEFVSWGVPAPDLKPEKGFNTEIGAAWQYKEILDLYGNFFCMGLTDELYYNNNSYANENMDNTRHLGANIGVTFTPVEALSFNASYSFVNAVFTAGLNKNNTIPLVPVHKLYGELLVKFSFGLVIGPNMEYSSESYFSNDFANKGDMLGSWFLLGAKARYVLKNNDGELAFLINIKNLLNRQYATLGITNTAASVYNFYPADGFSVNISLQYRF